MSLTVTFTGFSAGDPPPIVLPVGKVDVLRHALTAGRPWLASIPALASWPLLAAPPPLLWSASALERLELAGWGQVLSAYLDQPAAGGPMHMTTQFRALVSTERGQMSNRFGMGVASLLTDLLRGSRPTVHIGTLMQLGLVTAVPGHKPDLAGWCPPNLGWRMIVEAKGKVQNTAYPSQRTSAKQQAERVLAVAPIGGGALAPLATDAAFALLGPNAIPAPPVRAHLHDPDPPTEGKVLEGDPDLLLCEAYGFFARALIGDAEPKEAELGEGVFALLDLTGFGRIGLASPLLAAMRETLEGAGPGRFAQAVRDYVAGEPRTAFDRPALSVGADGVALLVDDAHAAGNGIGEVAPPPPPIVPLPEALRRVRIGATS